MPRSGSEPAPSPSRSGRYLVAGLLVLGACLGVFAVVFQWSQTNRCLDFYGAAAARAIVTAPHVELWRLDVAPATGTIAAVERCDVSRAPGLVHLRRGLVEDANFDWRPAAGGRLPASAWDVAIAFAPAADAAPTAILVVGGAAGRRQVCLVGRPGRAGLGRLEKGLATWIADACPQAGLSDGP